MARRRFISSDIVSSDAFMDMPLSAQALYMHLVLAADDDGFVGSPRVIQRMLGASEDDFKLLVAKRFALVFPSGVIVIKHFKMMNTIPPDRYHPTVYREEQARLILKENRAYTEITHINAQIAMRNEQMNAQAGEQAGNVEISTRFTECQQNVNTLETQLDKTRIDKNSKRYIAQNYAQEMFINFWDIYPRKVSKKRAYESWLKLCPDEALCDEIIRAVEAHSKTFQWRQENGRYIPHPSTWLNQHRWEDELPREKTEQEKIDEWLGRGNDDAARS